jgi:hypothetical protein
MVTLNARAVAADRAGIAATLLRFNSLCARVARVAGVQPLRRGGHVCQPCA